MSNSKSAKNPFLELQIQSSHIWNEYKAIDHISTLAIPKQIQKLRKLLKNLQEIDFETELKYLEEIHQ